MLCWLPVVALSELTSPAFASSEGVNALSLLLFLLFFQTIMYITSPATTAHNAIITAIIILFLDIFIKIPPF